MPFRVKLALIVTATFAVAAAAAVAFTREPERRPPATFQGAIRPPGIPPADFRLTDEHGRPATLADARGKVAIVTFLFTTCEDTCPLTAQQVRGALDRLGDDAEEDVAALAIAVDPPRDTPRRARRFLAEQQLTGRMRFLTGPRAELRRQWRAYGIRPQGDGFEHSAHVVLLDRSGVQRIGYPVSKLTPEALADDVRLLAAEDSG